MIQFMIKYIIMIWFYNYITAFILVLCISVLTSSLPYKNEQIMSISSMCETRMLPTRMLPTSPNIDQAEIVCLSILYDNTNGLVLIISLERLLDNKSCRISVCLVFPLTATCE